MRLILAILFLFCFVESFSQHLQFQNAYIFEELKINPSFPVSDNMIYQCNNSLYLLHNAKRPLGMDYDSLILYSIIEGRLHFEQNLNTPKSLNVSFIRSFSLNDSTLYFTDNNGVFLYKKVGDHFNFSKYVDADNTITHFNQEFGRFEAWHSTKTGILTTDFHIDNETKGGCKWMHVNQISNETLTLLRTDSVHICGNQLSTRNTAYPVAFNPSGTSFAVVDIPTYALRLHSIQDSFKVKKEFDLSAFFDKKLNSDSISLWSRNIENHIDIDQNENQLSKHFFQNSVINRVIFTSDSTLLILGTNDGFQFLELNLQNDKISIITLDEELKTFSWFTYSLSAENNIIYLLTPNKIIIQDGFSTKTQFNGWKLAKLQIIYNQ